MSGIIFCVFARTRILRRRADAGAFSCGSIARELTRLRKLIPWLREADAVGLQQTLRDLDGVAILAA